MKMGIALGLLGTLVVAYPFGTVQPPPKNHPEEKQLINSLEGQALYHEYCAVCHGKEAKGDGPMARVLKTAPPDLTRIALRNGGTFPFQRVQRIISGESEVNAHGTREMPLWGPIFSQVAWDQDLGRVRIYNLVRYLEKLQTN
jgi:mono/diheme cytochrome c family protein